MGCVHNTHRDVAEIFVRLEVNVPFVAPLGPPRVANNPIAIPGIDASDLHAVVDVVAAGAENSARVRRPR